MKNILFFIFFLTISQSTYAQINHTQTVNNWRFGGSLGLSFGNNGYFSFNVSPSLGYMASSNFELGGIAGYQYGKDDYFKQNLFNVGPYINFYPTENLFLRANYMYYTGNQKYESSRLLENLTYERDLDESALWLGAGYQSSGQVRFQAGVMYNVLYKENESIFSSGLQPFMGVSIGL